MPQRSYYGLLVLLLATFTAGCNLALDLGDYPYTQPEVGPLPNDDVSSFDVRDVEDVNIEVDAGRDTGPVLPTSGPRLVFTELMIRTSTPEHSFRELGEYIEIKNIGDGPADPRRIIIDLVEISDRIFVDGLTSTIEERAIVDGLKLIEPGEYFVFVREDSDYYNITTDLEPGTFYEYGVWNESVGLSNQARTLHLIYEAVRFDFVRHDEVGWQNGALIDLTQETQDSRTIYEDIALGVRPGFETAKDNASPANWCYHGQPLGQGPLHGSPGKASSEDDCL